MDQLAAPQETRARLRPPAQAVGGHARPAESPVPSPVPSSMDKQLPATVQLPPATAQLLPTGICASTTSTTTTPVRASPTVRASPACSSPAVPATVCSSPAVPATVCSSPAVPAADIPPATSSIGAHVSSPARPKILLSTPAPARINLPTKSKNLAYLSRVWGMRWIHDK